MEIQGISFNIKLIKESFDPQSFVVPDVFGLDSRRYIYVPPGVGYEDGESSYFDDSGSEGSFVQGSFNDDGDRSLSEKDFWLKSGGVGEVKTHIRETSAVIFISSDSIEVGGSELGIFIENKVKSKLLKVSSCGPRSVKSLFGFLFPIHLFVLTSWWVIPLQRPILLDQFRIHLRSQCLSHSIQLNW